PIHPLEAGEENLRLGRLFGEERRRLMDRPPLIVRYGARLVDRIADHVDDAAQRAVADRHRNGSAGVRHLLTAHQPFARIHGDGAHGRFAEMLGDFEHQAIALILRLECIEDRRQLRLEMDVDDGADDLRDVPDWIGHGWSLLLQRIWSPSALHTASAPEMISMSSLVIIA